MGLTKICLICLLLCLFSEKAFSSYHWHEDENIAVDSCRDPVAYILHPNPVEEYMQISIPERCFQPYILKIYNIIGELINTCQVNYQFSQRIDVSNIANGVYMVILEFEDKTISKKFSKDTDLSNLQLEVQPEDLMPSILINNNFN